MPLSNYDLLADSGSKETLAAAIPCETEGQQQQQDEQQQQQQQPPLSAWRLLSFGLAAPPLQMTSNIVGFFFSLYLLEVVHLSPAFVSAITFAGRLWDAMTDPIVGQLVSRTGSSGGRCGRTKPWLLVAAPLGSLAFFAMWNQHDALHTPLASLLYYLAAYLMYCTFITCYHVPYTASTMLISSQPQDKDAATASRIACELLFTIIGCGAFGAVTASRRIASHCGEVPGTPSPMMVQMERDGYRLGGGIISVIFVACGCAGVLGIVERVRPQDHNRESLLSNVLSVLSYKPYLLLMLAFLFMSLAIQIVQVNLALFTTHSIDMAWHTNYAILCVLSVAVLCVPIWYRIASSWGKKPVFFAGLLILLPCLLFAMLMPTKSAAALYTVTCLAGLSISVAMLLPWSMLPDVIDAFYCETGSRKEATFYSLYVFFTKFASGISLAVSQLALAVSGYDSNSCEQLESVGTALRLLVGPAPIACVLASLLLIHFYPIDAEYRLRINRLLMAKSGTVRDYSSLAQQLPGGREEAAEEEDEDAELATSECEVAALLSSCRPGVDNAEMARLLKR